MDMAHSALGRTEPHQPSLCCHEHRPILPSTNLHLRMSTTAAAADILAPGPVCVDISGTTLTDHERDRLRHPLTGMVILFTRNYESPEQLSALCADIHRTRPGILIAVDHEGGRVQRFRTGFTEVPSMASLAEREDRASAFRAAGAVLAAELLACGVDLTFAPVLDVNYGRSSVIGNRSFGSTPMEVIENASAFIDGLMQAGMASCGKHFPGHGWAEADSHVALPTDERDVHALSRDMEPYRAIRNLASLMTAHVSYEAYHGELATFSATLLKEVLRSELGFDGLVFSDDLSMKAAELGNIVTRAEKALAAGCDMVLICNHPEQADELLAGLRWQRTADFDRRFERLRPKLEPLSEAKLAQARDIVLA